MAETLKRNDPPSRPVDGDITGRIVNKRPDRWYILANPNDEFCGVRAMEELGFEVERHRGKDSPRIKGGPTSGDGDVIVYRGQYLMSCPLEVYQARYNEGQRRADEIDKQILRPGGLDQLRGPTGRLAYHTQESTGLTRE